MIGMVLDWTGKTSRIPLTLHNLLRKNGVPQDVLRLVANVELRIFHMKNLSADVRRRFTSDLGFVADYLNEGNFEKRKQQKIVHVDALCEMMTALTEDTRFMEQAEALLERQREKEEVHMCEYIDMLEARGQARGEAIGEARGQAKGEKRLGRLIQLLLKEKRYNEIERVSGNRRRRQELYRQYGI